MKNKLCFLLLIFLPGMIVSCKTEVKGSTQIDKKEEIAQKDTVKLREASNEDDVIVNEYLSERLKPIRSNFKRINSIVKWSSIETKDLWESTEGGEARFYYLNGKLEKIVAKHFGETFQQLSEYYLIDGQLSFVFEKYYRYNVPIYYQHPDKENGVTETFDFDASEIVEERSYFEHGKLIHQVNNQDCGSPFAEDYLLEQEKRIKSNFESLNHLIN